MRLITVVGGGNPRQADVKRERPAVFHTLTPQNHDENRNGQRKQYFRDNLFDAGHDHRSFPTNWLLLLDELVVEILGRIWRSLDGANLDHLIGKLLALLLIIGTEIPVQPHIVKRLIEGVRVKSELLHHS